MDILLAFAAGLIFALWISWTRDIVAPGSHDSITLDLTPPPPDESPVTTDLATSRLNELARLLGPVGEASAHPSDLTSNVLFNEAVAIFSSPAAPLPLVTDYVGGGNWMLAAAACAGLAVREDRQHAAETLVRQARVLSPWPLYYALRYFTTLAERPAVGAVILGCHEYWTKVPLVASMLAEHFSARAAMGDPPNFGDGIRSVTPAELANTEAVLRLIDHPVARALLAELARWRRETLDRTYLQTFGRFVENGHNHELLIEHAGIRRALALAEAAVFNPAPRSLLVAGEPRVGKTSLIMLLAGRAAARGWTTFEAGSAGLLAGQQYFGQLEERLQRLTSELAVEKRVLWYVPDLLQLALSGTHPGQSASVLDQVLPAITSGRIVVLAEVTPDALTTLLHQRPALRSLFEIVRLEPPSDAEVEALARDLAVRLDRHAGIASEEGVIESAAHLARHYLGTSQMPGATLDLIKLTAQRASANDQTRMGRDDLLATLSQLTGMPSLVLDDRERLDLAPLRQFFSSRVLGQDEAVQAMVDRIAMLKAGLTDPHKPIGVFLFAGPTGTGKTELAKTLATFLFGSDDRLLRLDMSEFQTPESTRKILGEPGQLMSQTHSLAGRIRKQPFSVVLLDEFEKAHPNAWDLFLQVFDDGRLADAAGDTVDFRHCIIVLTSNLGAAIPQGPGLGFASQAGAFSEEHVIRAIHQSFRPEFINRLDAIIVFRPLTRDLMRSILSKELSAVLERRGLREREWAVEWESSALEFLLDKGFSPTMGARPLKRAIDRYVLAPLAATLVEHRFPQGDQFLFFRSDGRAIQVEFVDPDAPTDTPAFIASAPEPDEGPTLARMMLQPSGSPDERAALLFLLRRAELRFEDDTWMSLAASVSASMLRQGFWSSADRFRDLSRYALLDRLKAAIGTARGLAARLERSVTPEGRYSRDLVARLATQLFLIQHGTEDALSGAPVEVVLSVQAVLDSSHDATATARWCERLADMYRRWGTHRHMQVDDVSCPSSPVLLVVSGFGAERILTAEAGLHVLEYDLDDDESARAVVRVRVAPTPDVVPDSPAEQRAALVEVLNAVTPVSTVIRRYRVDGSPLVRDVAHGWRTGRADLVLSGHFDVLPDVLAAQRV